jgi:hypothetical protein
MIHLSATRCSYIAILGVSVANFAAISLGGVASRRAFIAIFVHFIVD